MYSMTTLLDTSPHIRPILMRCGDPTAFAAEAAPLRMLWEVQVELAGGESLTELSERGWLQATATEWQHPT
eukprot:scaffold277138_cov16-Prasinocladus_malaysianus.AAC.2